MMAGFAAIVLAVSVASTGGLFARIHEGGHANDPGNRYAGTAGPHATHHPGGRIMPDGPGNGWGFPNNNPDGYGWTDYSTYVPLGANRTVDYYMPRYWSLKPTQVFMATYYNPYVSRGQRYISYTGCGGHHPFGGAPTASAEMSPEPYTQESELDTPVVQPPRFGGRVEAPPIPSGASGLIP
jgi:hypothetical protein